MGSDCANTRPCRYNNDDPPTHSLPRPTRSSLEIIQTPEQLSWARQVVAKEHAQGYMSFLIDAEKLHAIEPALGTNDGRFLGAVHLPLSIGIDSARATHATAEVAQESGARFWEHAAVTAIEWTEAEGEGEGAAGVGSTGRYLVHTADGRRVAAPKVVIAAGAWSRMIGQMIGVDIPVVPVKGQV